MTDRRIAVHPAPRASCILFQVRASFVIAGALTVVAIVACSTFESEDAPTADAGTEAATSDAGGDAATGDAGLLEQGLVAAWLFDEGAGTIAHDHVGGKDGMFVLNPGWTTGHDGGSALLLHGPDDAGNGDYVLVPASAALTAALSGTPLTIAFWLNHAAGVGGSPRVFSWRDSVHLKLNGERLTFELDGNGAPYWAETSKVAGKWHHLAATFAAGEVAIYEDGVKDTLAGQDGAAMTLPVGTNIYIGVGGDESDFATGAIQSVYLWNRALSADEIKQVMRW